MSLALYVSLNKAFSTTDLANLTLCQDFFAKKHTTQNALSSGKNCVLYKATAKR